MHDSIPQTQRQRYAPVQREEEYGDRNIAGDGSLEGQNLEAKIVVSVLPESQRGH